MLELRSYNKTKEKIYIIVRLWKCFGIIYNNNNRRFFQLEEVN